MDIVGGNIQRLSSDVKLGVGGEYTNTEFKDNRLILKSSVNEDNGLVFYESSGNWISDVIKIDDKFSDLDNVVYDSINDPNVTLETRTSDDGVSFGVWETLGLNAKIISPKAQYIQFKVNLKGATSLWKNSVISNFKIGKFLELNSGIKLKKNYKESSELEDAWTGEGRLYKYNLENSKFHRIESLTVLNSNKVAFFNDGQYKIWLEPIASSFKSIIPKMTSNTQGGRKTSASSINSTTYDAWRAFNKVDMPVVGNIWVSKTGSPQWLSYENDTPKCVRMMNITSRNDSYSSSSPVSFQLQGYNNSTGLWETIFSKSGETWAKNQTKSYTFDNVNEYKTHRLYVSASGSRSTSVAELDLFEYIEGRDGEWIVIDSDVKNNGMTVSSSTFRRVDDYSPLDELNGDIDIVSWSSTQYAHEVAFSATPMSQFTELESPIELMDKLGKVNIQSSGTVLVLLGDGVKWYKWNGVDFEVVEIDIPNNVFDGNTTTELNSITEYDFNEKWSFKNLNIGLYLKSDTHSDNPTINSFLVEERYPSHSPSIRRINFSYNNTTPVLSVNFDHLLVDGVIEDLDGSKVQYRVILNDKQFYPEEGFTVLSNSPQTISLALKSTQIKINDWNEIKVEFKDSFGKTESWSESFIGKFSGLMFLDESRNYYSTDVGELIKYLVLDGVVAGRPSAERTIILKNEYSFDVENVTIRTIKSENTPVNLDAQYRISGTEEWNEELHYDGLLPTGGEFSFDIRIISELRTPIVNGDTLTIIAKAYRSQEEGEV